TLRQPADVPTSPVTYPKQTTFEAGIRWLACTTSHVGRTAMFGVRTSETQRTAATTIAIRAAEVISLNYISTQATESVKIRQSLGVAISFSYAETLASQITHA